MRAGMSSLESFEVETADKTELKVGLRLQAFTVFVSHVPAAAADREYA